MKGKAWVILTGEHGFQSTGFARQYEECSSLVGHTLALVAGTAQPIRTGHRS